MASLLFRTSIILANFFETIYGIFKDGYAIIGLIAIPILVIVNFDVFFRKNSRSFPGAKHYLFFLIFTLIFFLTDFLWGILDSYHLANGLFVDTSFYFIAMGASILFWGMFVSEYIGKESRLIKPIIFIGYGVFALQMVAIVVNIFIPVLFKITKEGDYSAMPIRYVILVFQILMFALIITQTANHLIKNRNINKRRHIAICSYSVAMIVFLLFQVFYPLLPLYSFGCLFGITVLHTFVLEDQKMEKQKELEEARYQVEIDVLTGMKSKHAYVDREEQIDKLIASNEMGPFAIVVFDLNDLKLINDTYGHDAGDSYIIAATKLIASIFENSEIYRIGGDEFAAILLDKNYENREQLVKSFHEQISLNVKRRGVIVSCGLSEYIAGKDNTFIQVFNRADKQMYQCKHQLKEGLGK